MKNPIYCISNTETINISYVR